MKKLLVALMLMVVSVSAFAHHQPAQSPPSATTFSTEAQGDSSGNNDRGLLIASTAAADAVCNSIVRQKFGDTEGKVLCAVGVMAVAGLREHPDLGAAAIGTGTGTLLSYAWKF